LSQHNCINRIYVKSNSNKEEYFIADDTVIELIHSKLSLSRLTEAWIKSLFIYSLKKNIKKTKLIFRTENNYKSQIIQSPGSMDSNLILEEYINIFKNYSEKCLPLPPESTYKYVEAKIKSKDEKKAFLLKRLNIGISSNHFFILYLLNCSNILISLFYSKLPQFSSIHERLTFHKFL